MALENKIIENSIEPINGKLVIPVGLEGHQKLYVITKTSESEHEEVIHEDVAFVPMLPGTSKGAI